MNPIQSVRYFCFGSLCSRLLLVLHNAFRGFPAESNDFLQNLTSIIQWQEEKKWKKIHYVHKAHYNVKHGNHKKNLEIASERGRNSITHAYYGLTDVNHASRYSGPIILQHEWDTKFRTDEISLTFTKTNPNIYDIFAVLTVS